MEQTTFFIKTESCSRCGICVETCPAFLLEKTESGIVHFKKDFLHLCLGCGQCMAVCKTKSVFANGLNYENNFFEFTETDDFFSLIAHRRSVRRFKPSPLNKEEIDKILAAISQAPHGDSHMHVEITVVNGREKIMEMLPLFVGFYDKLEKWLHNPLMRFIIKSKKGIDTLNTLKNHLLPRIEKGIYREYSLEYDGITRGAPTILIFHAPTEAEEHTEDSFIYATYATLAAQQMGLGSTINGLIAPAINKSKILKENLQIPKNHEAVISLIIGHPKYKYWRGIKRNLKKVNWINS